MTGCMVVTGHYIDANGELVKVMMSFRPLPPPHNGTSIAKRLSQTLIDWKLVNKLAFVTLDNASVNGSAMSELKDFVNDHCQDFSPATSNHFHLQSHMNINMKHPTNDVPTRWNSTYDMIELLLPCRLVFQQLSIEDNNFETCPTKRQWDELKIMKKFFKPFKKGILNFTSGTPTSQVASSSKTLNEDTSAFHQHMIGTMGASSQ
ncbi:hypothetical protein MJO28_002566, partial [Puccinia striiformis f. sp. tritici]